MGVLYVDVLDSWYEGRYGLSTTPIRSDELVVFYENNPGIYRSLMSTTLVPPDLGYILSTVKGRAIGKFIRFEVYVKSKSKTVSVEANKTCVFARNRSMSAMDNDSSGYDDNYNRVALNEYFPKNAIMYVDGFLEIANNLSTWANKSQLVLSAMYENRLSGTNYGKVQASAYSTRGLHKPRIKIDYLDLKYGVSNITPNNSFVNRKAKAQFFLHMELQEFYAEHPENYYIVVSNPKIANEVQWKSTDGVVHTLNAVTQSNEAIVSLEIAENTFPSGTINIRTKPTTEFGIVGNWSNWFEFSTVDAVPTSSTVSPKNNFISNYTDNLFFWKHETAYGTPQHAYDLQYWQNENIDSWVNLKTHEVTQATSLLVPKGTFATGTLTWRIRTYNMDDVPGDWSVKAVVNVIGRPNAPTISAIDSTPRPTIYWNSAGQEAYQLIITKGGAEILDTKPIYGYAKLFKTPLLLDDGAYIYSLRIKNKYNIWSEFAAATTEVKNGSSLRFSLRGESVHDCAELSWSGVADALHYLVYRNETAIAKTNALYYTDLYASGENQYRVRAILAGDNYAASDTVTIKSDVTRPVLRKFSEHATQNDKLDLIMRRGEKPSHEQTNALISQAQFYTGRMLPVVQVSQFAQNDHSLSYTLKSKKELEKLLNFRGLPVAYKSKHGVVIGVITTVNVTNHYDGMPDVSFTIAETDSCLDVQYD